MATLDDSLRLLSAVPWFDNLTARDLLALGHGGNEPAAPSSALDHLRAIERAGLLLREGRSCRIVEPLRSDLRQALYADDARTYWQALRVFSRHAENGLNSDLLSVMGEHGSRLNVEVVRTAANEDDGAAFDRLVDRVRASDLGRERQDSAVAAELLESYLFKRDRRVEFLRGLHLWLTDNKAAARNSFELVLKDHRVDKASAISAHLVGVHLYSDGYLSDAEAMLRKAVEQLEAFEDRRGLAMTLTTLGRLQRDLYREHPKPEILDQAVATLEEAVAQARQSMPPDPRLECQPLVSLAQTLVLARRFDEALGEAERAVTLAPDGEMGVWSRSILAGMLRELGRYDEARAVIEDARMIARRDGVADRSFARLLNVSAASERRAGDLRTARRFARESMSLGIRLRDQRHVAHASHTLASVLLDMALESRTDAARAAALLSESEGLLLDAQQVLAEFRNSSGVEMVESTLRRLNEVRRTIGGESGED
ncbi:hypothetical protein [Nocardioides lijunqiniae]|uniref:hypothetical protein n=1 Tax=Nocardioides lijunqiniae TaxID=2760832 RepID=UPI00187824ED|nr:hypothetical protein [Nocardioides lijunqiniae]